MDVINMRRVVRVYEKAGEKSGGGGEERDPKGGLWVGVDVKRGRILSDESAMGMERASPVKGEKGVDSGGKKKGKQRRCFFGESSGRREKEGASTRGGIHCNTQRRHQTGI